MRAQAGSHNPLETLIRLMLRTMRMLYGGFWISLLLYAGVLLALPAVMETPAGGFGAARVSAAPWEHWQFLFGAAGIVSVYLSWRLRLRLLNPRRLRRGAESLYELAERLRNDDAGRQTGSELLGRAAEDLLGRAITAHVVLWILVEIPAILGIVDRLVSGDLRLFIGLVLVSAIGLVLQRPSRERIAEMIGPLAH